MSHTGQLFMLDATRVGELCSTVAQKYGLESKVRIVDWREISPDHYALHIAVEASAPDAGRFVEELAHEIGRRQPAYFKIELAAQRVVKIDEIPIELRWHDGQRTR